MAKILRITTISLSLEKLLSGQIRYMEEKGFEMYTASFGEFNYKSHYNITHLRRAIKPFHDILALVQIIRLILRVKPDIVHTHTPKAGLLGMCASWYCEIPIRMHTVAGLRLEEEVGFSFYLLSWMERLTYYFSTNVYPNSYKMQEYIKNNLSDSEKITVIGKGTSNGINLNFFSPLQLSNHHLDPIISDYQLNNKLVFLFIGRVVRDKGIVEMVNSFVRLHQENRDVVLLIVGPFEPDLDPIPLDILTTINNHPAIYSIGYHSDVRPYIAVSDILVFPSYREGFPNVPLQCGAFKKALILSDINGCNEIVQQHVTGILVKPKSESELLGAMKLLADDEKKRLMYGEKVFAFIQENYNQEEVWQAIENEYKEQISLSTKINA
jgi:glycosyltransferase involved in cell wall biosynthesis